jgi:hypothetical protein
MRSVLGYALVLWLVQSGAGCAGASAVGRAEAEYDKATGRLQLVRFDSNNNGKLDTFRHMDGARLVRIDVDSNEDGRIERWEYYGSDQQLEKVGFSLQGDGIEDAWAWVGRDGVTTRVESSPRRDGKISRKEYFEAGVIQRAEEDGDGDGVIDKWETYSGLRLSVVAFDTRHGGIPDRRLVYGTDSSARMEIDPDGTGRFVPAPESSSDRVPRGGR